MTSSQVLYRKWRPQTLSQVVGQGPITQTLLNALNQGRVAHAYLFCGPRGTGKTSTARILAKALNCATNDGRGEPCTTCGPCMEVNTGSFVDLIEVDGASNRGIDEIRDLRDKVTFMPAAGRVKVYIIDEVHMLTPQAFNALLKTLEEPPPYAYFLLATTEPEKVPLTIASRCQRFDFHRIPNLGAVERLQEISAGEGFDIDSDALEAIVRASGGSLRDAANLLEQVVLTVGGHVSAEQAVEVLGTSGSTRARELISSLLLDRDLGAALRGIARLQSDGADMRQVHIELVEELRMLLLLRAGAGDVLDVPPDQLESRREIASQLDLATIRRTLSTIAPLSISAGGAPLLLELAFVETTLQPASTGGSSGPANDGNGRPIDPAARRSAPQGVAPSRPPVTNVQQRGADPRAASPNRAPTQSPQQAAPRPAPTTSTPSVGTPPPPPVPAPSATLNAAPPRAADGPPVPDGIRVAEPRAARPAASPDEARPPVAPNPPDPVPTYRPDYTNQTAEEREALENLQSRWREIVDSLRGVGSSGALDAFLRSVSVPIAVEGDTLVIGFYHKFHREKIEDIKYRRIVEMQIAQFLGKHYEIRTELVERQEPRGHLIRAAIERGAEIVDERQNMTKAGGNEEP
ncbi:MAG: DNA polymerase III subunit gamma/tau [Chloroflexi bacterium]|nr:DNA polymerase III subunit gamma/tau [Chloroflexota bacterium]